MSSPQPANEEDRRDEEPAPLIEFSEGEPQNNAFLEIPVEAQDQNQSNRPSQDRVSQAGAQISTTRHSPAVSANQAVIVTTDQPQAQISTGTHPPTEATNQAVNVTRPQRAVAANQAGNTRHTSTSLAQQSPSREPRTTQAVRSINTVEGRTMDPVRQEVPPPFLCSTGTDTYPTSWFLQPISDPVLEAAITYPKTVEELIEYLRNWTEIHRGAAATGTDRPQVSAVATSPPVPQPRSHVSHAQQRSLPTNSQTTPPVTTDNVAQRTDQTPLAVDTPLGSGFRNLLVLLSGPNESAVSHSTGPSAHSTPSSVEQVSANGSASPAGTSHERTALGGSADANVPTGVPSREGGSDSPRGQQLQCPFNPRDFECLLCGFKLRDLSGSPIPDMQIDRVTANEEAIAGSLEREARLAGLVAELVTLVPASPSDQCGRRYQKFYSIIQNLLSHLIDELQQQPALAQPTNVEQQNPPPEPTNVQTPLQQATAAAIENLVSAINEDIISLTEPVQPVPVQLTPVQPVQLSAAQTPVSAAPAAVQVAPVRLSSIPVQAATPQAPVYPPLQHVPIQSPLQLSSIHPTPSQAALQLVPGQAPGQFSLQLAPLHSTAIAAAQPPSAQQTETTIDKLLRLVDSLGVVDLRPTSDSPRDLASPLHSTPDRDKAPGLRHYTDISMPSTIDGGAENVISTEECMKCCYPPPPTRRRSRRDCDCTDRDPEPLLKDMYPIPPAEACSRCCSPHRRERSRSESPASTTYDISIPASVNTPVSPATRQRIQRNLDLLLSLQEQYLLQSQPQMQNVTHSVPSQNRTLLLRALQHLRQHDIEHLTDQQRAMQQSMLHLVLRELHDMYHRQRQRQQSSSPARSTPVSGVRRPATSPTSTPASTPRPRPRVRFS